MQRGGNPTAFDRVLATRLGARAVEALASGENCHMTCFQKDQIGTVPLSEVFQEERQIDARKLLLSQVMAQ
jgi:6-phosphofructokinase 1